MVLTLTQSLAAFTKEVQSLRNQKTITVKITNNIDKQTISWEGVQFWDKPNGDSNTAGHAYQVSMKEILATQIGRDTRINLPIQSVWADPRHGLKERKLLK